MIHIDFQGGAHGNFLEFVCNIMAGVSTDGDPFNSSGASHNKRYFTDQVFFSNHYSFMPQLQLSYPRVIAIHIGVDDLLSLSQISLLRAGDYGYDNDELEIDTYNKLNNKNYRWVLDTILSVFFHSQIKNSYDAVRDPSWPDVSTIDEFAQLPDHICKECLEVHNLKLIELNAQHPNCPRYILREFFQIGFENPHNHGFITQQQKMMYPEGTAVYVFPFDAFYNTEKFLDQIELIASWAKFTYTTQQQVLRLHHMFLQKQPYKNSKVKCDQIVQQLIDNNITPPKLTLIEEAYVNAMLKKQNYECRY